MDKSLIISILIPVYNVDRYLAQCLDSVLSQTYPHLQVVLVDDGSSDSSWEVCCKYAEIDNRVEVYHQENCGVAETRNHLIEKIKGDYFLFVDSDDWIEPDMVDSLLDMAIQNNADIVNCKNVINDANCDKGSQVFEMWSQEQAIYLFLRHEKFRGSLCTKLVKVDLINGVRFQEGISLGEDALFCWHFLQKAQKVLYTEREYYHYRMLEDSLTHLHFGPRKMTAYIVWKAIINDVNILYPQYADVAKARFCIEMILLLRCAAQSQYPEDCDIMKLQEIIKENVYYIKKVGMSSWRMILYGEMGAHSYSLIKAIEKWNF